MIAIPGDRAPLVGRERPFVHRVPVLHGNALDIDGDTADSLQDGPRPRLGAAERRLGLPRRASIPGDRCDERLQRGELASRGRRQRAEIFLEGDAPAALAQPGDRRLAGRVEEGLELVTALTAVAHRSFIVAQPPG